MRIMSVTQVVPLFAAAILLCGCGGGSGGSSSGNTSGGTNAGTNTGSGTASSWTLWTRQLGASGSSTWGKSVATDATGNIYVAGYTTGNLDNNILTGYHDLYVTKYDTTGIKLYTRQLGVASADTYGKAVATDANGNVYVAGDTTGGLDGNTLTNNSDYFVTKYDATGAKVYTKQLGGNSGATWGNAVTTDANNNIYVAGYTQGGFDGNTVTGYTDFFVTKYAPNGTRLFTRQLGVNLAYTIAYADATDTAGNVYVVGETEGGLDGNTLTGTRDFFMTKYDASGTKLYTRQLGAAGASTYGTSVATDTNGNVYVAGYTTGNLDGNTLMGIDDFFVTEYDAAGNKLYTKQLGATGAYTYGYSVATDAYNNIYIAGYTTGSLDGGTLTGFHDLFVTKYDATGTKLYTKQMGVAQAYVNANSVTTDSTGNVYITGDTSGGLDGNTLTGNWDFFLTAYKG